MPSRVFRFWEANQIIPAIIGFIPVFSACFESENDRCFGGTFDPTGKSLFAVLVLFDGWNAGNQFAEVAFGKIEETFAGIFEGLLELGIIIAPSIDSNSIHSDVGGNIRQNATASIGNLAEYINIWFSTWCPHFL